MALTTYTIFHKFTIGDIVWIVVDCDNIVECRVDRITLEVDPDDNGVIQEKRTYHLDPVSDKKCKIILRPEEDLFASLEDVLEFRATDVPPVYPDAYSVDYYYTVDDITWIVIGARALESVVNQITIIIDDGVEETWYHVLPTDKKHHLLIKLLSELFETEQDALDYILDQRQTPTPTPEITPTVTPTPTFVVTPTVTPSLTPVAAILDEDFEAILDEYFDILLSE